MSGGAVQQDSTFDSQPVIEASIDDLDLDLVAQHLSRIRSRSNPHIQTDDPVTFLRNRKALYETSPTVGALLVFGRDPQAFLPYAEVSLTHFYGTGVTAGVRHGQNLGGTLSAMIAAVEDYLWEQTLHGWDQSVGLVRRPLDQFPRVVLRELTVNAVCHRDFSRSSRVRINVYADRIEWTSPGSLPPPVTIANILDEQATRNPLIVKLLSEAGLIEERGTGLDTVVETLQAEGMASPTLRDTGGSFIIAVQGRGGVVTQRGEAELTDTQLEVLQLLRSRLSTAIADIEQAFPQLSRTTLHRTLEALMFNGYIRRVGKAKATKYYAQDR